MRTEKAMLTAALVAALMSSMSVSAQQAANSQPAASVTTAQPVPQASAPAAPAEQPAVAPAPTTMDQVVDLFIQREHALIKMLAKRTPIVETYLQNLSADPQLGPVPSADHYFLGRMDMGENVERKDYLKDPKPTCRPVSWAASRSSSRFNISPWDFLGWSMPIIPTSTANTMASPMFVANSSATCAASCSM